MIMMEKEWVEEEFGISTDLFLFSIINNELKKIN